MEKLPTQFLQECLAKWETGKKNTIYLIRKYEKGQHSFILDKLYERGDLHKTLHYYENKIREINQQLKP